MRICVAGGTGQAGSEVVAHALQQGHKVSVISRRPPSSANARDNGAVQYFTADATTGDGLEAALAGADVLIDCLEGRSGKALRSFANGGSRLLAAAAARNVPKAVLLSIINCDRSSSAFYQSKAAKEAVYAASGMQTVVVRVTQFHSLLDTFFTAGKRVGVIPVFRGSSFQPIAPADAAALLLSEALAPTGPAHRVVTAGGPEVASMREFAAIWQKTTGARGRIVEFPLPGEMGRYFRSGVNLVPDQRDGNQDFESWLAARLALRGENL